MLFNQQPEDTNKLVPAEGMYGEQRITFVGDYPTTTDLRKHRPFSSSGGELLFDLVNSIGIRRKQCYLTNVIKELTPNINSVITFKKNGVTTTPLFQEYLNTLKAELSQVKSNVIVATGPIALYALTGQENLSKRRGSVYTSNLIPGKKVIPILQPSSAIRNYLFTHFITADLMKIKSESEFPEIRETKKNLIINPSYEIALAFLDKMAKEPSVAIDIEVINEEVSHISFSADGVTSMAISFYKNGKNFFSWEEETKIWRRIGILLENKNVTKLIQNGSFDAWFLYRKYGIIIDPIIDTMIAQAFTFPDFPKGLDFLCSMYTDIPYYKDEGKKHMKIVQDEDEFSRYNAKDSLALPIIMKQLENDLKMQGNWDYFLEHCRLIQPLTFMQEYGIRIDKENLKDIKIKAEEEIKQLEQEFKEVTKMPDINLNSATQMKNYFYIHLGIKPYTKSVRQPDGSRKTTVTIDEKALSRLAAGTKARAPRVEASILLKHRKIKKLSSTYYDLKTDSDGRFRTQFNPVGTKFSRLSSAKNIFGSGQNIQNIPSSLKDYFLADPGHIIVDADLSQADWRIVAYLAQEYNMISALESGVDIHKRTASLIFNKPESEISDEKGSTSFGNGTHSERFLGKKLNHALNYNMSANELALQLQLPLNEAKILRAKYLNGYPGIENVFWESIKKNITKNRTVINLFNRSYPFVDRIGPDLFKAAYAYIPQSTVADIVNKHGLLYIYYRQDLFKDVKLVSQVHDSIVFQIPISIGYTKIAGILKLIKARLETPITYKKNRFIIPAEMQLGTTWGNIKEIDFKQNVDMQIEQIWRNLNGEKTL